MNTKLKFRSQPSKKLNNKKFLKKLSFINAQACKLIQENKYKESIDLLKNVEELQDFYEIQFNMGICHKKMDEEELAAKCFARAVEIKNDDIDALTLLGGSLTQIGQLDEAIDVFKKLIKIRPEYADHHNDLGICYRIKYEHEKAIEKFKDAISLNPNHYYAYSNWGIILKTQKKFQEALIAYKKSLEINPQCFEALLNIANVYIELNNYSEAENFYKKALKINPNSAELYNNYGSCLLDQNKVREAKQMYEKSYSLRPNHPENLKNIAVLNIRLTGNTKEIIQLLEKAMAINPYDANIRALLSFQYFKDNQFEKFKEFYVYRLYKTGELNHKPPNLLPDYRNVGVLKNKRILLYNEQGIGDEIFLSGLIERFDKENGCQSDLISTSRLVNIFQRSFNSKKFYSRENLSNINIEEYDQEMPVGSVMEFLDYKNLKSHARDQFIFPDEKRLAIWKDMMEKLDGNIKVGISWRGGRSYAQKRGRSINLSELMQHLPKNFSYVSLQYDASESDIKEAEDSSQRKIYFWNEVDPSKELENQIAQIKNLDLIVSAQNSTVHLGGALGVPTLAILPFGTDFRYQEIGSESFFYKSVKVIRQRSYDSWSYPLENLGKFISNNFHQKCQF